MTENELNVWNGVNMSRFSSFGVFPGFIIWIEQKSQFFNFPLTVFYPNYSSHEMVSG